jgi:small-conductance mechanosensitive channel
MKLLFKDFSCRLQQFSTSLPPHCRFKKEAMHNIITLCRYIESVLLFFQLRQKGGANPYFRSFLTLCVAIVFSVSLFTYDTPAEDQVFQKTESNTSDEDDQQIKKGEAEQTVKRFRPENIFLTAELESEYTINELKRYSQYDDLNKFEEDFKGLREQLSLLVKKVVVLLKANKRSLERVIDVEKNLEQSLVALNDKKEKILQEINKLSKQLNEYTNKKKEIDAAFRGQDFQVLQVPVQEKLSEVQQHYNQLQTLLSDIITKYLYLHQKIKERIRVLSEYKEKIELYKSNIRSEFFKRDSGILFSNLKVEEIKEDADPASLNSLSECIKFLELNSGILSLYVLFAIIFFLLITKAGKAASLYKSFEWTDSLSIELYLVLSGVLLFTVMKHLDPPQVLLFYLKLSVVVLFYTLARQMLKRFIIRRSEFDMLCLSLLIYLTDNMINILPLSPRQFYTLILIEIAVFTKLLLYYAYKHRPSPLPEPRVQTEKFSEKVLFIDILVNIFILLTAVTSGLLFFGYLRLGSFAAEGIIKSFLFFTLLLLCGNLFKHVYKFHEQHGLFEQIHFINKRKEYITRKLDQYTNSGIFFLSIFGILYSGGLAGDSYKYLLETSQNGFSIGTTFLSVKGIFFAIIFVVIGIKLSKIIQHILLYDIYSRIAIDKSLEYVISTSTKVVIYSLFGLFALTSLGIDVKSLLIVAGGFSLGAGFGLQSFVQNFASGVLILAERTLKVGDLVTVNGITGTVYALTLRSTIIKTPDEAEIIIPNSKITTEQVTNWSRSGPFGRMVMTIIVDRDTDREKCRALLIETVKNNQHIRVIPSPEVHFRGFVDNGISFQVIAWVDNIMTKFTTETELHCAIAEMFTREEIQVPLPRMDVLVNQRIITI